MWRETSHRTGSRGHPSHTTPLGVVGDIKIMEPTKIDEWKWFSIEELPENMLLFFVFMFLFPPRSSPSRRFFRLRHKQLYIR